LLAKDGVLEGESRRVRWSPNPRLIRYYTTLGLLDPPAEMRGRTAYYGPRHLLQLVAVKRLQLEGRTLGKIQHLLAGLPDAELEKLAGISPSRKQEAKLAVAPEETSFWRRRPSEPRRVEARRRSQEILRPLAGLRLHPHADLVLEDKLAARLDPAAFEKAAQPLRDYFQSLLEERDHDQDRDP
jgi:DNA-binding transcriptional MerR regulator